MDIYDAAIKRLRADPTPIKELHKPIGVPFTTLRDIRTGFTKNPRVSSVKLIAKYYFPKQMSA